MKERNVNLLCQIRDIYRSIADFENEFIKKHDLCLNEGMLLCTLSNAERLSSGEIAEILGLTNSNASKVIRAVEKKDLIKRELGDQDKRQMNFILTSKGLAMIKKIKTEKFEIPDLLRACLAG
ncbi:MAG: MarR family transcriptional regulator [Parabacteroides sp.]|nr:MarR family transcriptional regulator [Parabacteroides sp.]